MTLASGMQLALKKVEETLGPVSILVNNAGIYVAAGVLDQTPEDWDKVMETNLNACFLLSKLAAQSMVNRRQGKIINITSMYSLFGSGFFSFLQRCERSFSTADQIDGNRAGAV